MRHQAVKILSFVVLLALCGCDSSAAPPEVQAEGAAIKIVVQTPAESKCAQRMQQALEVAHRQRPVCLQRPVELCWVRPGESVPQDGVAVIRASADRICAGESLAVELPAADGDSWVLGATADDEARGAARFLTEYLAVRKVGVILDESDDRSIRMVTAFARRVVDLGGSVEQVVYVRGQDASPDLAALTGGQVEAVFMCCTANCDEHLLREVHRQGGRIPVLVTSVAEETRFVRGLDRRQAPVYVVGAYHAAARSSRVRAFVKKYGERSGGIDSCVVRAVDAYWLLLDSIELMGQPELSELVPHPEREYLAGRLYVAGKDRIAGSLQVSVVEKRQLRFVQSLNP